MSLSRTEKKRWLFEMSRDEKYERCKRLIKRIELQVKREKDREG